MFAPRYWARRFFAGRYWPRAVAGDDANRIELTGQLGAATGLIEIEVEAATEVVIVGQLGPVTGRIDIEGAAPSGGGLGPLEVLDMADWLLRSAPVDAEVRGQLGGARGRISGRILRARPPDPIDALIVGRLGAVSGVVLAEVSWSVVLVEDDELIEMGVL